MFGKKDREQGAESRVDRDIDRLTRALRIANTSSSSEVRERAIRKVEKIFAHNPSLSLTNLGKTSEKGSYNGELSDWLNAAYDGQFAPQGAPITRSEDRSQGVADGFDAHVQKERERRRILDEIDKI